MFLTPFLTSDLTICTPPQLIPGHEAIGNVVEVGKNVKDFQLGDRVVADVGISVSFRTPFMSDFFLLSC